MQCLLTQPPHLPGTSGKMPMGGETSAGNLGIGKGMGTIFGSIHSMSLIHWQPTSMVEG